MLHRREGRKLRPAVVAALLLAVGLVGKLSRVDAASTFTAGRGSSLDHETTTDRPTGSGGVVKSHDTPSQRYFDAVASKDRENFIKYHLDKALEQRIPDYRSRTPSDFVFASLLDAREPEDFSVNLLEHFMGAFGLTELHVYEFVALNVICFPSGWCFNPDDVGNICCPF